MYADIVKQFDVQIDKKDKEKKELIIKENLSVKDKIEDTINRFCISDKMRNIFNDKVKYAATVVFNSREKPEEIEVLFKAFTNEEMKNNAIDDLKKNSYVEAE